MTEREKRQGVREDCGRERGPEESILDGEVSSDEEILYDLADFFKVFSDSTRIRILNALMKGELRVLDIAENLQMTASAISHQLRILKGARLVKNRREGKEMYYSLDDDHIVQILDTGLAHLKE